MNNRTRNDRLLLAAVTTGAFGFGGLAHAAQGLYSADELTDAAVYASDGGEKSVGEVEDILLDEAMRVRAIVVETGDWLDLNEKEYVIETGRFTVQTRNGDDLEDIEYTVHLDMTRDQLGQQALYDNDWWMETKQSAHAAWMSTRKNAASAWEDTKAATANALGRAGAAIDDMGDDVEDGE